MKCFSLAILLCLLQGDIFCSSKPTKHVLIGSYGLKNDSAFKWYVLKLQNCTSEDVVEVTQKSSWLNDLLRSCQINRLDDRGMVTQSCQLSFHRGKKLFKDIYDTAPYTVCYGFKTEDDAKLYAFLNFK